MNVEIKDSGPSRKTLTVAIPAERVKTHVQKIYREASKQVQLKGFRPGKVPQHVLRQKLGEQILAEANESILNETFQEAMKEQELDIFGTPRLDVSTDPLDEDKGLEYTVDLDIRPEVTVGDVKTIRVEKNPYDATDEDLESSLDQLAQSKRKLQPVDDKIGEGDFAKVNLSYKLDGSEVVKKEGLQINSGIPIRGTDAEEFKQKLIEQSKGQTITIPIDYPDTFEKEDARGKSGEVDVEILEVVRFVAPEIDEEFAKGFDFDSVDALKSDLREKITEQKTSMENARIEEEILTKLYEANEFVLPEGLIEEETRARSNAYFEDLKRQGAPEEEAKRQVEGSQDEIKKASRIGVRNLFLVEALAQKQKLFVTESDVDGELKRIASENDTDVAQVRQYFEEKQLFGELRLQLMNGKVREYLRKTADLVDSKDGTAGGDDASSES